MGASKLIKKALIEEGLKQNELASLMSRDPQQVRNALHRDRFTYGIFEEYLNAMGYEVVIRNKDTGKIID